MEESDGTQSSATTTTTSGNSADASTIRSALVQYFKKEYLVTVLCCKLSKINKRTVVIMTTMHIYIKAALYPQSKRLLASIVRDEQTTIKNGCHCPRNNESQ